MHSLDDVFFEDHGKVVQFERSRNIMGKKITYYHKGIVFVPRAYNKQIRFLGSGEQYIRYNEPYVIHFWNPGPSKEDATIRIDKISEVILGDPWRILDDEEGAFPIETTIDLAISQLGQRSLRMKYSLAGNNCGNFVARIKYGDGGRDTEFPTTVARILNSKAPPLATIANVMYRVASRPYNEGQRWLRGFKED